MAPDLLKTCISYLVETENIDGKLILTAKAVKNNQVDNKNCIEKTLPFIGLQYKLSSGAGRKRNARKVKESLQTLERTRSKRDSVRKAREAH